MELNKQPPEVFCKICVFEHFLWNLRSFQEHLFWRNLRTTASGVMPGEPSYWNIFFLDNRTSNYGTLGENDRHNLILIRWTVFGVFVETLLGTRIQWLDKNHISIQVLLQNEWWDIDSKKGAQTGIVTKKILKQG